MITWFIAHPWMTLILGILSLIVIEETVANICNLIRRIKRFNLVKSFADKGYTKEEIMEVFGDKTDI